MGFVNLLFVAMQAAPLPVQSPCFVQKDVQYPDWQWKLAAWCDIERASAQLELLAAPFTPSAAVALLARPQVCFYNGPTMATSTVPLALDARFIQKACGRHTHYSASVELLPQACRPPSATVPADVARCSKFAVECGSEIQAKQRTAECRFCNDLLAERDMRAIFYNSTMTLAAVEVLNVCSKAGNEAQGHASENFTQALLDTDELRRKAHAELVQHVRLKCATIDPFARGSLYVDANCCGPAARTRWQTYIRLSVATWHTQFCFRIGVEEREKFRFKIVQ
jgi:hypothetical protein